MKNVLKNRNLGLIVGIIIMLIAAWFLTPQFYGMSTFASMIRNNCVYAFLAVSEMLIIMSGAIDLSGPSVLAFTACATTLLYRNIPGIPMLVLVLIAVLMGICCGALSGLVTFYFDVQPMIATLGTSYIIRGITYFMTGKGQQMLPNYYTEEFKRIATGKILGLYNIIWVTVLILILAGIFLNYMQQARRMLAIGSNRESAQVAGINVRLTGLKGFMIAGGICGLAGIMYAANYAMCLYSSAEGFEMTAIATCILGGAAITGGEARISGNILAILLMTIITVFISMLPGLSIWSDAIQGSIIIAAVLLNIFMARSSEMNELKERGQRM